jgi:hypothetical protein
MALPCLAGQSAVGLLFGLAAELAETQRRGRLIPLYSMDSQMSPS